MMELAILDVNAKKGFRKWKRGVYRCQTAFHSSALFRLLGFLKTTPENL